MNETATAMKSERATDQKAVWAVRGVIPIRQERGSKIVNWKVERGARRNYRLLGRRLAQANDLLYRNGIDGHGLIQVSANGDSRLITKAGQFAPVIVDSLTMKVTKESKLVSELPPATHLNAMLRSEAFLGQFQPVDQVAKNPLYLDDFSVAKSGYHDGGKDGHLLYVGPVVRVEEGIETIKRFLGVMDFATNADRTNTVAAALTVLLRHRWHGEKPVVVVTATKSHAGKGTITEFIRGTVAKADVLYESIDWPMQSQFQRQISQNPDIGMVYLDNVRLDSAGGRARFIRSAFIESFVTSPEINLASPGAGESLQLKNRFVIAINTNDGSLSPDLLNRALSIHLAPKGNVQDRQSSIGNPKLEFLPQNRERIEAELRGMIERWKNLGRPLDETVKHPMTPWGQTIGGILKVNRFTDFLANYGARMSADDPIREALAILAGLEPGKALRPGEWADHAVDQGLAKTIFSAHERDTSAGRERGIGVLFSRHLDETFDAMTPTTRIRVRLDGGFRRWEKGMNPHMRYLFVVLEQEPLPVDDTGNRKNHVENGPAAKGTSLALSNPPRVLPGS